MDRLDMGIIRTLGETEPLTLAGDPRASLRRMAKRLGVDKDTVSRRMKRLQEQGVLNGWATFVNPRLIGANLTRLLLDLPEHSNKEDLVRKFKLMPGVMLITTLYGDALELIVYYDSEQSLRKTTELISRISNAENITRFDTNFPECRLELSKTDWKLIRVVQKNPLESFGQISKDTGISQRTAKRRISRLFSGLALGAFPRFDPSPLDATTVALLMFYEDPAQAGEISRKVISRFGDQLMMSDLSDGGHGFFIFFVPNAREAHNMSNWAKSLPGVLKCRADIVLDHIEVPDALSEILDRRAPEALQRA